MSVAIAKPRAPGRGMPHNLETEKSLLGGVFLDSTVLVDIRLALRPDDFYSEIHRRIYGAMLELDNDAQPIDIVSVADKLQREGTLEKIGGAAALMEITEYVPTAAGARYYADLLKKLAVRRKLIQTAGRIIEESYDHAGDAKELLDDAERKIMEISAEDRSSNFVPIRLAAIDAVKMLERLTQSKDHITGLATGFTDLDRLTSGLHEGELIIVAGRPAMGKTSLGLNMALNAAMDQHAPDGTVLSKGKSVAIFSLEMPIDQLVMRLIAGEAEISMSRLRSGQLQRDDWFNLTRVTGLIQNARIQLDDSGAITLADLRSQCRRLAADPSQGLDLVIIDYLQLMSGRGIRTNDSREQEISAISRGLKMLAKELKVPIVALSQLNRSPEGRNDKRPMMSDLRESGAIEQDADLICFIYRDEVYDRESEDKGVAEVIIGKQRNGPTGVVKLAFRQEYTKFANLDKFHKSEEGGPAPF